ncbi:C-5 sterol desaturase Erg31 [Schizosaccharomyces japonicus yFS275]|uniref:C-5 sterol desaturase Erg31 n=1 Tax=Schizosaccharomyces japonicus (strain yFS275 / FY16936) TaxID=402676 RepID=B6JWE1_SCHJY|nr:C-5 sterol desaturase Erg31 [Schizosaccharomyces japonicus yFS275]EEB05692.1 C-5 sterol desaturase Erg31 [Schizosaccharomyces japonicus yFS275]
MDYVLSVADTVVFDKVYGAVWPVPRDNIVRQTISLYLLTWVFGVFLYGFFSSLSYHFVFDKSLMKHPKFLKNQVRLEIMTAMKNLPGMAALTVPWFLAELHGYSYLYDNISDYGWKYYFVSLPLFVIFSDFGIYWAHRFLHHRWVYPRLHKLHHKWIICTPFASHAFKAGDGFLQSLPYHLFPFFFPLHKLTYLGLFTFVNFWSIMIHDGKYLSNNPIINGAAHHNGHHLYFNYNYGQFTTLFDRLGGSFRAPDPAWFDKDMRSRKEVLAVEIAQMEEIQKEVEGDDDRDYVADKTL